MWKLFKWSFKTALGLGVAWVGLAAWVGHYGRIAGKEEGEGEKPQGEAIVVMGARVLPRGRPSPALRARAERAARLFHGGAAPLLLVSGGKTDMPKSEAQAGCEVVVQKNVPLYACLLEEQSRSTAQNAEFSAPLLRQRGVRRIVLVSDGYHLLRACAHFRREGFSVLPVASGRALHWRDALYWTAREAVALLSRPWLLWWAFERDGGQPRP
ncbi:MAG: YdcF family protein [Cystobacterineae bacterium]|nr:YdcF family protein [Cystobacterineae bacterium]